MKPTMFNDRPSRSARRRAPHFLLWLCCALAGAAALAPAASAQTAQLKVRGSTQYVAGIDQAWFSGSYGTCFGVSPVQPTWGSNYNSATVDADFADIAKMHRNVVRIWLFEMGQGLQFDSNGNVSGLDPTFMSNIDDVVARADKYNLAIYFTFTADMGNLFGQTLSNGATAQNFVSNSTARTAFINNAVTPFVQRYSGKPAIFGYEAVN